MTFASVFAISSCIVCGIVALDEMRRVAVAAQQMVELLVRNAREHGRIGDLVAVEMQDRQHRAVAHGIEELVRMPARRQRPGLGLAVADDAGDDQVGIVERRAVGVRQRVAELAALVDRARRLRRDVARDAAGEGELGEEPLHPLLVLRDVRIDLAVGPLEIGVGDQPRAAVAGAGDVDHVEVELFDQPVEVDVDEVEAGRRAPMAEQARLDVLLRRAACEQRIVEEIDLADGQIVGGAPVGVDQRGLLFRQCVGHDDLPSPSVARPNMPPTVARSRTTRRYHGSGSLRVPPQRPPTANASWPRLCPPYDI